MPSGLGPWFDCSDVGIAMALRRARAHEKELPEIMERERKDILRRIGNGEPITADEQRI